MCSSPACCVCTRLFALEVTGNNFVDYGLFESENLKFGVVRTSSQVVSKFLVVAERQLLRGMRRPTSLPVPSGDSDTLSSVGGGSRGRYRSPPRRPADLPMQTRGRSPSRVQAASRANTPGRSSAQPPSGAVVTGSPTSAFGSPEVAGPLPYSAYVNPQGVGQPAGVPATRSACEMVFLEGVPPGEFVPPVFRPRHDFVEPQGHVGMVGQEHGHVRFGFRHEHERFVGEPHGHERFVGEPHEHDRFLEKEPFWHERLVDHDPRGHDRFLHGMVEQHVRFADTKAVQEGMEHGNLYPQHVVDELCASNLWTREQRAWLVDSGASSHMIGENMLGHVHVLEETCVSVQAVCHLVSP